MVAIAENMIGQITFVPFIEEMGIIVRCFSLAPHVERLVHHNEPHPVAQLKQLRCRRIMGCADTVYTHFLQYLELPFNGSRVDSCPQTTQVVVHADSFYFGMFAIEEESLFGIECEGADTERSYIVIGLFIVNKNPGLHFVQRGVFERP